MVINGRPSLVRHPSRSRRPTYTMPKTSEPQYIAANSNLRRGRRTMAASGGKVLMTVCHPAHKRRNGQHKPDLLCFSFRALRRDADAAMTSQVDR